MFHVEPCRGRPPARHGPGVHGNFRDSATGRSVHDQRLDNAHRLLSRLDELETELSRVHHALEHHERLATLGTIAGLIAHEFNNILTPVMSYAQMALAAPEDRDLSTKALQKASEGAERASQIASAILGFVRDDNADVWSKARAMRESEPSSQTPPLPPSADVLNAAHDAVACMGRDPARDLINLTITGDAGLCAALKPFALQHILLNLILNARSAMLPLGGELTIEAHRCGQPPSPPEDAACSLAGSTWNIAGRRTADAAASKAARGSGAAANPGSWAVIRVRDTGRGMRPETLARVFEPFYTTSADCDATTARRRGTGLGMTMCKRLADEVGGYIIIESAVGQGTTVTVVLPEAPAAAAQARRSA